MNNHNAFKGFPSPLNYEKVVQDVADFLSWRSDLIQRFGVTDPKVAKGAITLYRMTVHPKIVQIHLGKPDKGGNFPGFIISAAAQEKLWMENSFLRWRYASSEEQNGQYQNPAIPVPLRAWGSQDGRKLTAVLFVTTTMIGEKFDASTPILIMRDDHDDWQTFRAYQLNCAPDGRAWQLGNAPLSRDVLPGCAKLNPPAEQVERLIRRHRELREGNLPDSFQFCSTGFGTSDQLLDALETETKLSEQGPRELVRYLDGLFSGTIPYTQRA